MIIMKTQILIFIKTGLKYYSFEHKGERSLQSIPTYLIMYLLDQNLGEDLTFLNPNKKPYVLDFREF